MTHMSPDRWVTILVAIIGVVGGTLGRDAAAALFRSISGRGAAQRQRIEELAATRDAEATRRRRIEEHASQLRRRLHELGEHDLPRWPGDE